MEKLNVEITMRKVQKYKFWLHTSTHDYEQVDYFDFAHEDDESCIYDCLEDWASQFFGWYRSYAIGLERIGEPFIQKTIEIPVAEMHKLFELTDSEKLTAVRFYPEYYESIEFVIGVNEPNENPCP